MKWAARGAELTGATGIGMKTNTHTHRRTHMYSVRAWLPILPTLQTADENSSRNRFPAGVLALENESWLCLLSPFLVIDSGINVWMLFFFFFSFKATFKVLSKRAIGSLAWHSNLQQELAWMGTVKGPLPKPSLSRLTEYWSGLWQRDWASQRMLRLAGWTAGTTAGEMPSPSEYKGDFFFLFKWENGSLCFQFAKSCLLNTATGLPAVGPVLKREQSANARGKRRNSSFLLIYMAVCVSVTAVNTSEDRLLCMHFCVDDFSVISISKTNILSKHMQTHHQQQKQQNTSLYPSLLQWLWFICL